MDVVINNAEMEEGLKEMEECKDINGGPVEREA
jgi:hypothetical protein